MVKELERGRESEKKLADAETKLAHVIAVQTVRRKRYHDKICMLEKELAAANKRAAAAEGKLAIRDRMLTYLRNKLDELKAK